MVEKKILYERMNQGVLSERLGAFRRNLGKNLPLIERHGGLETIVPLLRGRHVVIVGAGPSLDREAGILKKYQHRDSIAIIASDMALLPLMEWGVRPRFVISCETTPAGFFDPVDTSGTHLLAFSCISHYNLLKWQGKVSFYNWMVHNELYDSLWERAGLHLGFVATGSIVTTQAVSLALGCAPLSLLLVGNDMGFDRRFYARNTVRHRRYAERARRDMPLETLEFDALRRAGEYMIDRGGRVYFTNNQFLTAKVWLEELFSRSNVPIYDCSEPGCSEKFVRKTRLKDFFQSFEGRKGRK